MKNTKRILSVVLTITMILSLVMVAPFTANAHPDYIWMYANDPTKSILNAYEYNTAEGASTVGHAGAGGRTQKLADIKAKGFLDSVNTPNVTYYIYAETAGQYSSLVSYNLGGTLPSGGYKMVVGVNDKNFYEGAAQTTTGWKNEQEIKINLEKGINVVRVLPHVADNYSTSTWVDVNSFNLPKNVGIEDRTASFKSGTLTFQPANATYYNKYAVQGTGLGGVDTSTMRNNYITFATMDIESLPNVPYYSLTVDVPADGYYSLMQTAGTATGTSDGTAYTAFAIDGKFYKSGFNVYGSNNRSYMTAYMTKGTHVITITAPYDFKGTWNGAVQGSVPNISWWNMNTLEIPGVTLSATQINPTTLTPHTNVLFADDSAWYTNGQVSDNEKAYGARVGNHYLIGGFNNQTYSYDNVTKGQFKSNEIPSINYTVKVDKAGTYDITVVDQVVTNNTTNSKDSGYFVAVAVNDNTFAKANFNPYYAGEASNNCRTASTVSMNLEQGINVIRVYPKLSDSCAKVPGWINFDCIKIDGPGAAVAVTSGSTGKKHSPVTYIQCGDSKLTNNYLNVTPGGNVGGVQYADVKAAGITYANLSTSNLSKVPYFAFKVTVTETGYYDFHIATNYGANGKATNGLPYIAAMVGENKYKVGKYQTTGFTNSSMSFKLPKGTTTVYFIPPLFDHFTDGSQWFDFGTIYSYAANVTFTDASTVDISEYKPIAIADVKALKATDDPAEVDAVINAAATEIQNYSSAKSYNEKVAEINAIVAGVPAKIAAARETAFANYKATAVNTVNGFGTSIYVDAATEVEAGKTAVGAVAYDSAKSYSANTAAVDAAVAAAKTSVQNALATDKATLDKSKANLITALGKLAKEGDSDAVAAIIAKAQADVNAYTYNATITLKDNQNKLAAIRTQASKDVNAQRAAEEAAIAELKAQFNDSKTEATTAVDALVKETNSAAMNAAQQEAAAALAALQYDKTLSLDENKAAIKAITDEIVAKMTAAEKAIADQLHVWTQYEKNITAESESAYVRFFFELDTETNEYTDYGFYVTVDGVYEDEKMSFYGNELDAIKGLQTPDAYDYSGMANKFVYAYFVVPKELLGADIRVQAYFTDAAGEQRGEIKTANIAKKYNLG